MLTHAPEPLGATLEVLERNHGSPFDSSRNSPRMRPMPAHWPAANRWRAGPGPIIPERWSIVN